MSCRARAREGWLYLFTVKRCGMSCARACEANLCKYLQRLSMSCRVHAREHFVRNQTKWLRVTRRVRAREITQLIVEFLFVRNLTNRPKP